MWVHVRSGPDSGTAVELPEDESFVLGRQRGSDLVVRDSRASRRHAELTPVRPGRWRLRDLGSANGTYVDGLKVDETELQGGEDVKIGDIVMSVTVTGPREIAPTPPRVTNRTPAGQTEMAPQLATQSMVRRLVDAGTRRASRTAWLAGGGAAALAIAVVVALLATGVVGGGDDRVPQVVEKLRPSTVLIHTKQGELLTGTGSGWVLDAAEGLIVTNAHVVNQGDTFSVLHSGRSRPATVVGSAPCEDLALLRVRDTRGLRTAALAPPGSVEQGETVVAMGYPADATAGDPVGSTRGVVSAQRTTFRDPSPDVPAYPNVLQTDTSLNPGNSGGPLVDLEGRVVGVDAAARTTGSDGRALQNVNYAITIDHARKVLAQLRAGRSPAWLGFALDYPTTDELQAAGVATGLRIRTAIPGTPADGVEVAPGEVLAGVNGRGLATPTLAAYCEVAAGVERGRETTLNFATPGREQTRAVRVRSS